MTTVSQSQSSRPDTAARRLRLMPVGMSLGLLLVISYVLCVASGGTQACIGRGCSFCRVSRG